MFGSAILDVTIGLILVYLLFSLVCSALMEAIELVAKSRAKDLERGFRAILNDDAGEGLVKAMYDHPLISALYDGTYNRSTVTKTGFKKAISYTAPSSLLSDGKHNPKLPTGWWKNLPSYVPASNFALALLDITTRGRETNDASAASSTSPSISMLNTRRRIESMNNPPVQRALLTALDIAQGDLAKAQQQIEAWYDSSMERVAGWYKRRTQIMLLTSGLAIAVLANVNSLRIARYLYHDKTARDALVAEASTISRDSAILKATTTQVRAAIDSLNLPIGWEGSFGAAISLDPTARNTSRRESPGGRTDADSTQTAERGASWPGIAFSVVLALVGWLATALAISLGAPFWFDLLNKFMVIRSTVKPQEKSPAESSKDRQTGIDRPSPSAAVQTPSAPTSPTPAVNE